MHSILVCHHGSKLTATFCLCLMTYTWHASWYQLKQPCPVMTNLYQHTATPVFGKKRTIESSVHSSNQGQYCLLLLLFYCLFTQIVHVSYLVLMPRCYRASPCNVTQRYKSATVSMSSIYWWYIIVCGIFDSSYKESNKQYIEPFKTNPHHI